MSAHSTAEMNLVWVGWVRGETVWLSRFPAVLKMRFVVEAKMQTQQHLPVIGCGNPLRRDDGVGSRVRRDFSLRTGPRPPKYRLFHRTPRHFPRPIIGFPRASGVFPRAIITFPRSPETFPRAISGFPRHRTLSPGHLAVSPGDLGRSPGHLDVPNASEVASSEQFMRFNAKSVVGRVTPCAPLFSAISSVKPSKHIKNATNIKT
jgi:hypothetical protein